MRGMLRSGCSASRGAREQGIALVAALFTVAAIATLAAASFTLLHFDLALVRNQQQSATTRNEVSRKLTLALLDLELHSQAGELPETSGLFADELDYQRLGDRQGRLVTRAGGADESSEVHFELVEHDGVERVRVLRWH